MRLQRKPSAQRAALTQVAPQATAMARPTAPVAERRVRPLVLALRQARCRLRGRRSLSTSPPMPSTSGRPASTWMCSTMMVIKSARSSRWVASCSLTKLWRCASIADMEVGVLACALGACIQANTRTMSIMCLRIGCTAASIKHRRLRTDNWSGSEN